MPPIAEVESLPRPPELALPKLKPEAIEALRAQFGPGWVGPHRAVSDSLRDRSPHENRVATGMPYGAWDRTTSGQWVWRLTIRSPGASSMRLHFEGFNAVGDVWLHPADHGSRLDWIGPYRDRGPHDDGDFWTDLLFAEAATITYFPEHRDRTTELVPFVVREISHIGHEEANVAGGPWAARYAAPRMGGARSLASCHLDLSCHLNWKSGSSPWQYPATALLHLEKPTGSYQCTGTVVNFSMPDDDFGLLTAGHCVNDADVARNTVFYWGYQTRTCGGLVPLLAHAPRTHGAHLVVAEDGYDGDFAFLRLNRDDVLSVTGITSVGWSTSSVLPGTDVVGISHPDGAPLRISFGETASGSFDGLSPSHFVRVEWARGTTEPGSSGSGLFRTDGPLVGVLTGGASNHSPCDPRYYASYHRLSDIHSKIKPFLYEAPPPAPVSIEVTLGLSGETVTLVVSADGTVTLGGEPFRSGDVVTASSGGRYKLELAGDAWSASYLPETPTVALGSSGRSVSLIRAEDGTYYLRDQPLRSGDTVTAANGALFRLWFSSDGTWRAVPRPCGCGPGTGQMPTELTNTIGMEFVRIPAGEFRMGSLEEEVGRGNNEGPVHTVAISWAFYMGKHEVTQGQWEAVMGGNPSRFKNCGADCPVEQVSWDEVQAFIRALDEQEGVPGRYRLPTEAEWEYAARAGTAEDRYGGLDEIAWYSGNSDDRTHLAGRKAANAWGLHDMLGNVWEWVADWYDSAYYSRSPRTDPQGPVAGSYRVVRGGSWMYGARYVRAAGRGRSDPDGRAAHVGFRLARTE